MKGEIRQFIAPKHLLCSQFKHTMNRINWRHFCGFLLIPIESQSQSQSPKFGRLMNGTQSNVHNPIKIQMVYK